MINTLYGVFASKFFRLGNTVEGDNITAKARCHVWKGAKSLNCNQTITDGSTYLTSAHFSFNFSFKRKR